MTSGNLRLLYRAIQSLEDGAEPVIICNTQNEEYYKELMESEVASRFEVVRTESNGGAGKGHQSVLDYFLEREEYTHLIKLDGDDFFLPEGHRAIRHHIIGQSQQGCEIDVLGLLGEQIRAGKSNRMHITEWNRINLRDYLLVYRNRELTSQIFSWFVNLTSVSGNLDYWFDRIVCFSRKGASVARYSETLPCVVDVQMNSKLKLAHFAGEINYEQLLFETCYLYDKQFSYGISDNNVYDNVEELEAQFFEPFTEEQIEILQSKELPMKVVPPNYNSNDVHRIVWESDLNYGFLNSQETQDVLKILGD